VLFGVLSIPMLVAFARGGGVARDSVWVVHTAVFSIVSLLACVFLVYYEATNGTPYPHGPSDDDYAYDSRALDLYNGNLLDIPALQDDIAWMGTGTWNPAFNYSIMLAFVYRGMHVLGFDPHPLYPRLLNAFALAIIASLTFTIARRCSLLPWQSRFAAYLCGLSPTMVFMAAHTYRDVLVALGILFVISALLSLLVKPALRFERRRLVYSVVLFASGLLLAGSLREINLYVLCAMSIGCLVFVRTSQGLRLPMLGILVVAGISVLAFVDMNVLVSQENLDAQDFYHTRHAGTEGNITGAVFRLPFVVSLPARFILRNVSPLPLPQEIATETFWRLGTVLWFFGLPFLYRSVREVFRTRDWPGKNALAIVVFGFLVYYLLNIATTLQDRHVVNYIPAASVAAMCGLAMNPRRIQGTLIVMGVIAGLILLAVLVIRQLL